MSDVLTELDKLFAALRQQAIERASALDPEFATDVAEGQKEIDEHQKLLDSQRTKKREQEPGATELLDLQSKMIETAPRPK